MAENDVEIVLKGKFENGKLLVDTTQKIDKNIKKIGEDSVKTQQNVSGLQKGLKKLAAVVGVAALANGFKNLVKGSLNAAGAMEQVDIALTTMLGSAEKAAVLQKDLIEFAKKTPFEIEGIFSSTKQLLAYGIAQEDIISTMGTLGNIAAGVGVDMNRLALAFGQVKTTGRLMGQDLNQFTQAGVPLLAALAENLGKTEAEILELKEAGAISFEDVRTALEGMTKEGGRFYNLMENQSKTFLGTVSNMADSFFQVKTALGDALLPAAKRFVNYLIPALENTRQWILSNSSAIGKFAQNFVTGLVMIAKGFRAVFKGFAILKDLISGVVVDSYTMVLGVKKAFNLLKLAIFSFVDSVLDKLSVLSKIPGFGWVDDAKKQMESLKDSVSNNIDDINEDISNIRAVEFEAKMNISAPALDAPEDQTSTIETVQETASASPAAPIDEKARLKALKEENAELLEEQKNYLAGYAMNESEADKLITDNKLMNRQQQLLNEGEYAARKQELDQMLLDNEISIDQYRQELDQVANAAKLEAAQEQYDAELEKFVENKALMDETKNEMQLTQDEYELEQLQMKYDMEAMAVEAQNQKLLAAKLKKDEADLKQKRKKGNTELKIEKVLDSRKLKGAEQTAGELVALQNSKNKQLAAIGKAAAMFQITTDTARGAMSAYQGMVTTFPGPAGMVAGAAAAAAVIAYGAERLSEASSASFAVGTPNIPQDQLANVHKGEMIVPATFSEAIRSGELTLSAGGTQAGGINEPGGTITNININFDGAQFVGQMDDEDISDIGERLGQLIAENIVPALPSN